MTDLRTTTTLPARSSDEVSWKTLKMLLLTMSLTLMYLASCRNAMSAFGATWLAQSDWICAWVSWKFTLNVTNRSWTGVAAAAGWAPTVRPAATTASAARAERIFMGYLSGWGYRKSPMFGVVSSEPQLRIAA